MKFRISVPVYLGVFVFGSIVLAPFVSQKYFGAYSQGVNSISGNVFGINRRPLAELHVELQDDLHRMLARTRTNGSGYYEFRGFSAGRLTIRVLTLGTEYEEQEQDVEIQNIATEKPDGSTRIGAFDDQQKDFYLKLRPGVDRSLGVVFAQDIPPDAQKLYDLAIADLDSKRQAEGLAGLRAAIEKFPSYYYALERLGNEYIRLGQPETFRAAELLLVMAVQINPRGFKSWYGLAYARYSLNDIPGASAAVQKAVELNAYSADAIFLSGTLLRRSDKFAESEKLLLKAKELSGDTFPQVHWELALLYGKNLKRYADAAKELKLFLKAQPNAKNQESIKKLIADFESKAAKG